MTPVPNELPTPVAVAAPSAAWQLACEPAGCPDCRQAFLVPSDQIGRLCPHCRRAALSGQPAYLRPEPPERMVAFQVQPENLRALFARFVEPVRFRSDDFNAETLAQRAAPIYWPMWLADADLRGEWRAEVGYDYQVKSSQAAYIRSEWRSLERNETRIRWEPRLGQLTRRYENAPAPALEAHAELLAYLGSYDLDAAEPYRPERVHVGQAVAALRAPDVQPAGAWPEAESQFRKRAAADCQAAAGGQHIRDFAIHPDYAQLNWTQMLLPMYVSHYTRPDGSPELVFVNAQTGKVGGLRLSSQRKGNAWGVGTLIAALILLGLGVIGAGFGALFPPLMAIGVLVIAAAFVVGVTAIYPFFYPWQWNRSQQAQKVVSRQESRPS